MAGFDINNLRHVESLVCKFRHKLLDLSESLANEREPEHVTVPLELIDTAFLQLLEPAEQLALQSAELERLREELEKQVEITYQYREQRDKLHGCVRNAIPGDYSMGNADADMGRMFQQTLQKELTRLATANAEIERLRTTVAEQQSDIGWLRNRIAELDAAAAGGDS